MPKKSILPVLPSENPWLKVTRSTPATASIIPNIVKSFIFSLRKIADRIAMNTTLFDIRTALIEAGMRERALNVSI